MRRGTFGPLKVERRTIRRWGYALGLACALSLPGSAYVLRVAGSSAVRAGGPAQLEPPFIPAGEPIDSEMVWIVPFEGDPEMAIGIPFDEPGMAAPGAAATPDPAATPAVIPPVRELRVDLQP